MTFDPRHPPTMVPMAEVGQRNQELMDAGIQACYGGSDGRLRSFEIPMSVRIGWAKMGQENPYLHGVETGLMHLDEQDFPPRYVGEPRDLPSWSVTVLIAVTAAIVVIALGVAYVASLR